MIYLDEVLKIMKERIQVPERLKQARKRLQDLLELSSLYRVSTLLNKIGDLELHNEIAILYGKLDQHDKALEILVHKLKDHAAAERHCIVSSQGKDVALRKKLFHMLLAVYLQPNENSSTVEQFMKPAIQLINSHQFDFDPLEALKMIPDDWAVGTVANFLSGAMRNSLHTARTKKIESSLTRANYLQSRYVYINSQDGAVSINDDRKCDVCHKPFTEPNIARYPNGLLCHIHCAQNRTKCPVTHIDFSKNSILQTR
eukprot:gene17011-18724_t